VHAGRTHRSNEVQPPLYKLVTTPLGGERRFAAAVARRLQSLGALTRGDRRAASGLDLSESNLDSAMGRKALRRLCDALGADGGGGVALPAGVALADIFTDPALPNEAMVRCDARMRVNADADADCGNVRMRMMRGCGLRKCAFFLC
jgi:hypothetical protein